MRDYNELRAIKVTYSNGTEISTSMSKLLTDEQMLGYFAVGRWFNIGSGELDNMQQIVKSEILN